jgi:L-phenylalanine/L-methionine N-acetyltransferase
VSEPSSLTIRGQNGDDWESLYALMSLTDVVLNTRELPYVSEDAFRDRFASPPANTHALIAETGLPSGRKRIVGAAWLEVLPLRRRHVARLTLIAHPDTVGSQEEASLLRAALDLADGWLGLRRIEVLVFAEDARALALYQAGGFEVEATLRRHTIRAGQFADVCLLARLAHLPQAGGQHEQEA